MERRNALRLIALGATAPFLRGLSPNELFALGTRVHGQSENRSAFHVLRPPHERTVLAAIDRILPESDTPGAVAAGVDRFIDVILADWYADEERGRFLAGLDELDRVSRDENQAAFADAPAGYQTALLERYDRDHAGDEGHWFGMLKHLTIWGYFTSEPGVTEELGKYARTGQWQGCARIPVSEPEPGGAR